jgi:Holliday junction resolvase RusA-like endonuclease
MKFTILTELPSANKLLRMHWAKRRQIKAVILTELWVQKLGQGIFNTGERKKIKKSVLITIYHRTRRFDKDNAYAAVKPVVDCLRQLGLIYNDSPRWLDLGVCQELDHKNPRTEVEIKET